MLLYNDSPLATSLCT